MSDSLTFLVSASAEGCLSALTVLFHNLCPIAIVTSAILTKIALCHYSNAFKTIKNIKNIFKAELIVQTILKVDQTVEKNVHRKFVSNTHYILLF